MSEEEEQNAEGEQTEAINARAAALPKRPPQEEVDAHMLTHVPFRSWCPHCVRGQSKGKPHKQVRQQGRDIPTVSADYMFMHEDQGPNAERGMPILVMCDASS